jgi:hypothetical protein
VFGPVSTIRPIRPPAARTGWPVWTPWLVPTDSTAKRRVDVAVEPIRRAPTIGFAAGSITPISAFNRAFSCCKACIVTASARAACTSRVSAAFCRPALK